MQIFIFSINEVQWEDNTYSPVFIIEIIWINQMESKALLAQSVNYITIVFQMYYISASGLLLLIYKITLVDRCYYCHFTYENVINLPNIASNLTSTLVSLKSRHSILSSCYWFSLVFFKGSLHIHQTSNWERF